MHEIVQDVVLVILAFLATRTRREPLDERPPTCHTTGMTQPQTEKE
jgi:hypothetical protein